MSIKKLTKQEETFRFPVSAKYNLETREKTIHYEDIPMSVYKEWIEYVVVGLAWSYYSQENIKKMEGGG